MVDQDEAKHRSMYLKENYTDRQCQTHELLINCPFPYNPNPNHLSNSNVCLSTNLQVVDKDKTKRRHETFDAIVEYWIECWLSDPQIMCSNPIQEATTQGPSASATHPMMVLRGQPGYSAPMVLNYSRSLVTVMEKAV